MCVCLTGSSAVGLDEDAGDALVSFWLVNNELPIMMLDVVSPLPVEDSLLCSLVDFVKFDNKGLLDEE